MTSFSSQISLMAGYRLLNAVSISCLKTADTEGHMKRPLLDTRTARLSSPVWLRWIVWCHKSHDPV